MTSPRCAVCGGKTKPTDKPARPADPWLCDSCARGHAVRLIPTKPGS